MAKKFNFEVLIEDRPGTSIEEAAKRLASRLEKQGLVGEIRHASENGVDEDMSYNVDLPFGRPRKRKEEK